MTKIAFLFLTIDNINHPFFWEEYFKNNHEKINIYCHPKNPKNVTIPWLKNNIISNLVETGWGYITKAYFNILAAALNDKNNTKFITISESCIPLVPFDKLYNDIMEDPKKSYIKFIKIKNYDLGARIKNQEGYKKYKFYKHWARFCLSRHHTKILLNKKDDFKFFNKMHVGDEFFLSLLYPFNNIDDLAITYDNWQYIHNKVDKINKEISLLYDKIRQNKPNNKELKNKMVSLKKLKETISKNPKSYNDVTLEDIKEAQNTNSYFWRKFPKNSNIIKYKTHFNYITSTKKLYFIHIPKTAGMSISELFYNKLKMNIGYGYYKYDKKYLKAKQILDKKYYDLHDQINKWHIPFSFFTKQYQDEIINKFKLFAIVRNPYERIISDYGFWIKYYNNNKHKLSFNKLKKIYDSFEVSPKNLNDYIHKVLDNDKYKYELDGHLIPMYKYTHINKDDKLILICEILKYENLNNEFNKFIEDNNINLPKDSLLKIHKNKSGIQITRKHLDDKSIKLIQEYYKKDFELFGYDINI